MEMKLSRVATSSPGSSPPNPHSTAYFCASSAQLRMKFQSTSAWAQPLRRGRQRGVAGWSGAALPGGAQPTDHAAWSAGRAPDAHREFQRKLAEQFWYCLPQKKYTSSQDCTAGITSGKEGLYEHTQHPHGWASPLLA